MACRCCDFGASRAQGVQMSSQSLSRTRRADAVISEPLAHRACRCCHRNLSRTGRADAVISEPPSHRASRCCHLRASRAQGEQMLSSQSHYRTGRADVVISESLAHRACRCCYLRVTRAQGVQMLISQSHSRTQPGGEVWDQDSTSFSFCWILPPWENTAEITTSAEHALLLIQPGYSSEFPHDHASLLLYSSEFPHDHASLLL